MTSKQAPTAVNEMWVVEWSPSQRQYHIQTVGEMLEANLRAVAHGVNVDYVPIAIARTAEEADQISNMLEAKFERLRATPLLNEPDDIIDVADIPDSEFDPDEDA